MKAKMKFLIHLTFIIGTVCAQTSTFNSAIDVLRELDQIVVPSINNQIEQMIALYATIGEHQPE